MTPGDDEMPDSARPPATSLPPRLPRGWERAEYQRLWLRMESRAWRTLAIVPGEEGMSIYDVANLIVALGVHHGESIGLFDFRSVRLHSVLEVIEAACGQMNRGERVIFAARSIKENLATIPLARATDGVVLCVEMGSTSIEMVEETIEQIGRERFLGSILVRPPRARVSAPPLTPWHRRLEARW